MKIYKQLRGLPEELEKWGVKALSKIESPEQADFAATELRKKMDKLWEQCPSPESEEKVHYILRQLGKAESVAEELKEEYKLKSNTKTDKRIGCICLILGIICAVISFTLYYFNRNQVFFSDGLGYMQGAYKSGVGVGAAAVCAIAFLVFGVWLLLQNKKKGE